MPPRATRYEDPEASEFDAVNEADVDDDGERVLGLVVGQPLGSAELTATYGGKQRTPALPCIFESETGELENASAFVELIEILGRLPTLEEAEAWIALASADEYEKRKPAIRAARAADEAKATR